MRFKRCNWSSTENMFKGQSQNYSMSSLISQCQINFRKNMTLQRDEVYWVE